VPKVNPQNKSSWYVLLTGWFTAWLFVDEGRYTLTERWHHASCLKMLLGCVIMIAISCGAYWLQSLLGM